MVDAAGLRTCTTWVDYERHGCRGGPGRGVRIVVYAVWVAEQSGHATLQLEDGCYVGAADPEGGRAADPEGGVRWLRKAQLSGGMSERRLREFDVSYSPCGSL